MGEVSRIEESLNYGVKRRILYNSKGQHPPFVLLSTI